MSPIFHPIVATALLVLGGCATVPSPSTPVVEGFRPDGGGGPTTEQVEALSRGEGDGIILRFAPGDELVLDLRLDGDVFRSGEDSELSFIVDRPIEAWMGPEGVRFRIKVNQETNVDHRFFLIVGRGFTLYCTAWLVGEAVGEQEAALSN